MRLAQLHHQKVKGSSKKVKTQTTALYPHTSVGLEWVLRTCIPNRLWGFPDSSVGKESAGDSSSISGSGRSPGEGIGYPLQYSSASFVAQLVKNLPTTRETWVRSLSWEDPLEMGKATHSSILAWRIPWAVQSTGSQRVGYD